MGTVAVSIVGQEVRGSTRSVIADVTLSSSYATGGDTVSLGNLGLREVDEIHVLSGKLSRSQNNPGEAFVPNAHGIQVVLAGALTAPKLKAYYGSGTEVANATNLSTVPAVRVEFRGS